MKKNIKKIITSTLVSAVSLTAIGCSSGNSKLASNINKGMAELVSSINNLDYVETSTTGASNDKIGKIVETSIISTDATTSDQTFLNNNISSLNIENTITRPSERTDNFKLYVLSESPFISFTSDDNSANFNMFVKFSTEKIEETSDEIDTKINTLILRRSILMIYVNEIYNGNVAISEENKTAINAYVNVIKENASFLKGNRGMVKNQLNLANDLLSNESNDNLVNYYIIKSGEALETRSSKIDSTLSAINSIIEILENNLTPASPYYQTNLSASYDKFFENLNSNNTTTNVSNENKELADSIAESLNLNTTSVTENSNSSTESKNETTTQEQIETQNNNNLKQTENNTLTNPTENVRNLNINNTNNRRITHINNTDTTENNINNNNQNNINQPTTNRQNSTNRAIRNINQNDNANQNTRVIENQTTQSQNENNQNKTSRRITRFNNRASNPNNNQNARTINQNDEAITNETNENKPKSITSNNMREPRIMRAERTQDSLNKEEFHSPSITSMNGGERAERVPYKTTTTFNQQ